MHSLCLLWSFLGLRCCRLISVIITILLIAPTSCLLFWIDGILIRCRVLCLFKLRSLARYHHRVCRSQLFNPHTSSTTQAAHNLNQSHLQISITCMHTRINYPFGGVGSKGEISSRNPQPAQNTKFCKCSPAFQTSSSLSASVPHLSCVETLCESFGFFPFPASRHQTA